MTGVAYNRVLLVGCGKAKLATAAPARELYVGSLFCSRASYAQNTGYPWWVVSARYGLLDPDEVVSPYDVTLKDLAPIDRAAWLLSVAHELVNRMGDACEPRELIVEIHAGADYAEPLHEVLRAVGFRPARPLEGLGIGAQMAWYKRPPYEPGRIAPWKRRCA